MLLCNSRGQWRIVERRRWRLSECLERFSVSSPETAGKFLAKRPGKVLPSSPLVASQSYLRWFPPPPLPFLLKDWDRSWTGNKASCCYWRTVLWLKRTVKACRRISESLSKRADPEASGKSLWTSGMWWHPEVTGARDTEEDVLKTTKASFWRPCLGSTVCRKLGEMSLTLTSSVSFFHSCTLRALGPKTSLPPMDITKRRSLSLWGRLTEGDSKTVCLRCIWKCMKSSVQVTPESWNISWASRTVGSPQEIV